MYPPRGNKIAERARDAWNKLGNASRLHNPDPSMLTWATSSFSLQMPASPVKLVKAVSVLVCWTGVAASIAGSAQRLLPISANHSRLRSNSRPQESSKPLPCWRAWFFGNFVRSRHLVCFLDNEGARFLILKGYASNPVLSDIVHQIAYGEETGSLFPWYAGVPIKANIADPPSTGVDHPLRLPASRAPAPDFAVIPRRHPKARRSRC